MGPTIEYKEGHLESKGLVIEAPLSRRGLHRVLGAPSRTSSSEVSDIDTWDDLGIYAYADPMRSDYSEIDVSLSRESMAPCG